jgi:hypothetical protein
MRTDRIVLVLSVLVVLGAGAFATDRYLAARVARQDRESAQRDVEAAALLISKHPQSFGFKGTTSEEGSLKTTAQESAARHGVTIGYLAENERDTEKGRREHQVNLRVANAPHSNLVHFLQELERLGAGAWVKEIHVRPSREVADAYEEAEIVLSKSSAATLEKKP